MAVLKTKIYGINKDQGPLTFVSYHNQKKNLFAIITDLRIGDT